MSVTQILQQVLSSDQVQRKEAEEKLSNASNLNFPEFMLTLCAELCGEDRPSDTRRLAGILMKNALDAKDRRTKQMFKERWLTGLDDSVKEQIKALLLMTIASPDREANKTSALVIAKIAAIELPVGKWKRLVDALLENMTNEASPVVLREGTLVTLGYICEEAVEEELDANVLSVHSNQILIAVVKGMEYNGADLGESIVVRRAATNALLNALEFVKNNFESETDRTYIMQTVCSSATYTDPEIRKIAVECLVKIAEHYYDYLGAYMDRIYTLTVEAIKRDESEIALQAIEFWSTIAEGELALQDEDYVGRALDHLCPVIFECLMQQEEFQDDDIWNKATAAGTCLDLLAECAPNKIIDQVVPFVEGNISDPEDWRKREAATMAFGSILEGPSVEQLNPLIEKAFPVLLQILRGDQNVAVRDTAAWTVGRVCHVSKQQVMNNLEALVGALLESLKDEPQVAKNGCWALHNLAATFEDEADSAVGALSNYAKPIIAGLIETTTRSDSHDFNLRPSAFEALSKVIQHLPQGNIDLVERCVPLLVEKLELTLQNPGLTAEDQSVVADTQGLICGALLIATQRLKGPGILPYADRIMQCYHAVLNQGRSASVSEEVLMGIGGIADALEKNFQKYVDAVMPFLITGLRSWEQYQVCKVAVGAITDVCRAIEGDIRPYTDDIVQHLLTALSNEDLDNSVKPEMLSCLGDIATAIGGQFERYFASVMQMLKSAAGMSMKWDVVLEDYDMVEWLLKLRSSIFEAYTGIFQGLKNDNKQSLLAEHNQWMLQYCQVVSADEISIRANSVLGEKQLSLAAGVIGDMVSTTEGAAATLREEQWVARLLDKVCASEDSSIRSIGAWARATIEQA